MAYHHGCPAVPAWRLLAAYAFGFQLAFLQAQEHGPVGAFKSSFDWKWKEGRATYFGDGAWPIHIGGCNYDYLWKDEGTGYDVVALANTHPEYVGSCGGCWEVRCKNGWTKDFYGEYFDRSYSCHDESASVIVRNVDTCKCHYPPNEPSNKRWCCGDMDHLDLSRWAFEKLAELRWGVIKLEYRAVPCDYQPEKRANNMTDVCRYCKYVDGE
ncbi:RlpA-like double-psi beta-barrel-protein domain-containing protein-containing protein [Dunaliella salina]|uniref:RlpA-like double-psi beta-barrel-protein domain-containing protein-containing protein n=1 Tax=Dunaliella salina TaxID=3046 RepID=A0ABQ7H789_DUNSA|nr:RlpA-like double-psi beta-barrel-protein domain-containing protein-containing protein [Dunaliella salina]|eukprot:KAF5842724.1 RlpA-like double-psi beta-barrel-protein domain-containing protein-containing protein [Dunaliella salina]